jgi:hypothetical protein
LFTSRITTNKTSNNESRASIQTDSPFTTPRARNFAVFNKIATTDHPRNNEDTLLRADDKSAEPKKKPPPPLSFDSSTSKNWAVDEKSNTGEGKYHPVIQMAGDSSKKSTEPTTKTKSPKPGHPKSRHPPKKTNGTPRSKLSAVQHSPIIQTIYNNLTMLSRLKLQDSRCKPTKNKHHWRDNIMISKSTTTTQTRPNNNKHNTWLCYFCSKVPGM